MFKKCPYCKNKITIRRIYRSLNDKSVYDLKCDNCKKIVIENHFSIKYYSLTILLMTLFLSFIVSNVLIKKYLAYNLGNFEFILLYLIMIFVFYYASFPIKTKPKKQL